MSSADDALDRISADQVERAIERGPESLTEFDDDTGDPSRDLEPADDLSAAELEALKPAAEDPETPSPTEVN